MIKKVKTQATNINNEIYQRYVVYNINTLFTKRYIKSCKNR